MSEYQPPLEDINFTLHHIGRLEDVSKLNGFQHADPATVSGLLEEAARFFSEVIAPLNRVGDEQGSVLTDDRVKTPDGFKEAYAKYVEAGWHGAHLPEEWGGGGLPYTVGLVVQEMFKTANMAFSLCPMLTQGAVDALVMHGGDEQKSTYLGRLVTGEWTGTMNLTEPQAGSDLGALRTKAVKQDDGTYRLFGTKIFITWGDHDLTENVVHLVLARTPDAPAGTRGISMFIVPKFVPDAAGNPGEENDIKIVSLEHKLGIHASPTAVVSFGDGGEGAVGYLLGGEQEGMRNMFTMMNAARIGVGLEGLAIGERAYQQAAAYARERVQGRKTGADSSEDVAIIEHPDVRRMLLTMKAYNQAMRALLYLTASESDFADHAESDEERKRASERVAVLTPLVKAWCTDVGVELASLGIQVHGGMGYVEETGAAQHFRDSRIAPIYEGTNGIQAIDLLTRKLPMEDGAVVRDMIEEMRGSLDDIRSVEELGGFADELEASVSGLADTSEWLLNALSTRTIDDALAGASPYLRQFATVVAGWLMARAAMAAAQGSDADSEFNLDKVATARFFGEHLLPQVNGLIPTIKAGNDLLEQARI
ncbi:MAG: acyl-CoA dehydrogenase [Actinobacteria bacterium]|nr:MAG: acyl-CoA dehydrogenase [Actinomycetota bacterium]